MNVFQAPCCGGSLGRFQESACQKGSVDVASCLWSLKVQWPNVAGQVVDDCRPRTIYLVASSLQITGRTVSALTPGMKPRYLAQEVILCGLTKQRVTKRSSVDNQIEGSFGTDCGNIYGSACQSVYPRGVLRSSAWSCRWLILVGARSPR